MPLTHQDVVDQLVEIGLLRPDEAAEALRPPLPPATVSAASSGSGPGSALAQVAARLRERGRITEFQAREIADGRARGLRFGDHLITDRLGEGAAESASGLTLKAKHLRDGHWSAIKVLAGIDGDGADSGADLPGAAANLDHPHAVRFREAGFDKRSRLHYRVMAYLEGTDLEAWLAARSPANPNPKAKPPHLLEICGMIIQAARGLAHWHDRGIFHRDVKPRNLLRMSDGVVKAVDWGLGGLEGVRRSTRRDCASPIYQAPEIGEGANGDPRSDIYSLGCVLWRMATGRPLFAGGHAQTMHAHSYLPTPKLCALRRDADPRLESVFQRMTAKAPGKRQQTMREVIDELTVLVQTWAPPSEPEPLLRRLTSLFRPRQPRESPSPHIAVANPNPSPAEALAAGSSGSGPFPVPALASESSVIELAPETKAEIDVAGSIPPPSTHWPPRDIMVRHFAGREPGDQRENNVLKMVFVWCPPGWVAMGGSSAEVRAEIAHGFWLSQCPVTQEQWRRLMGSERGAFRSGAGGSEAAKVAAWDTSWFPAESVTWAEASAFCRRLTDCERKAGRLPIDWEYRLPREAQWEHACRAGSGSRVGSPAAYGFGDEESRLSEHAWHLGNSDGRTHQVGDRKPNRWGLRDMHGNVWEWCSDLYLSEPFRGQADDELRRSVRGGAFDSSPQECRAAHRSCRAPFDRGGDLGFRVAIVSLLTDWGGWAGKDDGPPKDED